MRSRNCLLLLYSPEKEIVHCKSDIWSSKVDQISNRPHVPSILLMHDPALLWAMTELTRYDFTIQPMTIYPICSVSASVVARCREITPPLVCRLAQRRAGAAISSFLCKGRKRLCELWEAWKREAKEKWDTLLAELCRLGLRTVSGYHFDDQTLESSLTWMSRVGRMIDLRP